MNEYLFSSLDQMRVQLEQWPRDYNTEHPHSALGILMPIAFAAGNTSVPRQVFRDRPWR